MPEIAKTLASVRRKLQEKYDLKVVYAKVAASGTSCAPATVDLSQWSTSGIDGSRIQDHPFFTFRDPAWSDQESVIDGLVSEGDFKIVRRGDGGGGDGDGGGDGADGDGDGSRVLAGSAATAQAPPKLTLNTQQLSYFR